MAISAELRAKIDAIIAEEADAMFEEANDYIESGDLDRDLAKEQEEVNKKNLRSGFDAPVKGVVMKTSEFMKNIKQ